ncbi:MAG TPA: hypothetical protein VF794_24870 [Archangium sp.]|jgi:hypothetical protein|uniref:hypothetical protein n=1 Tax=Archangium sp. TaxID=1872627 RepID=UPI002ED894BA
MRTVLSALLALFVLSGLLGTPGLTISASSGAQARLDASSLARGDDDDKDDDEEDDDDDDDDEEFRSIG